jgi:hypothetical protein
MRLALSLSLASLLFVAPIAQAGDSVRVTVHGDVVFNQINPAPLSAVQSGESATMTFLLDTDFFENHPTLPTRGYAIDKESFVLSFDSASIGLQDPFPGGQAPYFVIRDNDPAVDGFLVTNNLANPFGVPLDSTGSFGQFVDNFYVTYGGSTLPSLDLLDALGSYDFTGLTVFNWNIDDGPFQAMVIDFASMTIELENEPWIDLGCELVGVSGDPVLTGAGTMVPGSLNILTLGNAAPSAPFGVFASLSSTPVPFKGGTLKPFPFFTPIILTTSPLGIASLPFVLPPIAPSGLELFVQCVIQDPAAVNGFALSNAVQGTVP